MNIDNLNSNSNKKYFYIENKEKLFNILNIKNL